ncbi:Ras-related protein Rab-11A [Pancytospora philotis]|nr:Ras-related protein Rab-11A [Pancytospora philotis]
MEQQKFDYLFKIVLIGDTNVGKTHILSRLIKDSVPSASKPTIGVEFGTKTFAVDGATVKAQIWDTAGQERYHAITSAYYRGSSGAVVVYDITKKNSLENALTLWLRNLRQVADPSLPVLLIGNKSDLKSKREVKTEEGREAALKEGMGFFETSALSGENVAEAFEMFIKQIYEIERKKENSPTRVKVRREELVGEYLKGKKSKKQKSSCC